VLSQLLPLLALKLGFIASVIVRLYSLNFIVVAYVFFLISTIRYRDYTGGLAILISSVFVMRYVFFLPVSEFYQGCLFTIVFWSFLKSTATNNKISPRWLIHVILLLIIAYLFHPSVIVCLAFIIGLYFILKKKIDKQFLILSGLFLIISAIRIQIMSNDGYETGKIPDFGTIRSQLSGLFETNAYKIISGFLFSNAAFLFTAGVFTIVCLRMRKYFMLGYVLLSAALYLCILFVTLPEVESPYIYDNYLPALGVILCLPLFVTIIGFRFRKVILLTALLFTFSTYSILQNSKLVSARIDYIKELCDYGKKFPEHRYLLDTKNYPWSYAWVSFSLPFETLVYQAVEDQTNSVTYSVFPDIDAYDTLINKDPTCFLGPEWHINMFNKPRPSLNKKYFPLPQLGYKKLNSSQDTPGFTEQFFDTNNVDIEIHASSFSAGIDPVVVVPVTIKNKSGHLLRSTPGVNNKIFLSYHLLDKNGEVINWDGVRTPLLVDIQDSFTQGLIVPIPDKHGQFILKIDMVTEGVRWWGFDRTVFLKN
jgi:hypothetical protein